MYFIKNRNLLPEETHSEDESSSCVLLNSMDKVKEFVRIMNGCKTKCALTTWNGNHRVNARSVMGIFSLDLTKPLKMIIYSNDINEIAEVSNAVSRFHMTAGRHT